MGIEFEIKFRATPEQQEQMLRELSGEEVRYEMRTVYYDTAQDDFSARRCTLRRRMENGRSVCTLKTPAHGYGRREWEVECASIQQAIEELCKPEENRPLLALAAKGLIPICGARFTRIARTVTVGQGTAELAFDRGTLSGGDRQIPLCEIEVEQKTCSQEECLAFANLLAARYGLQREEKSKFRRAQALYKGE